MALIYNLTLSHFAKDQVNVSLPSVGRQFWLRYCAELCNKHKEGFGRVKIAIRGFVDKSEEIAFDGGSLL